MADIFDRLATGPTVGTPAGAAGDIFDRLATANAAPAPGVSGAGTPDKFGLVREAPPGETEEEYNARVANNLRLQAEDKNFIQSFGEGLERGVYKLAKGVGLVDEPNPDADTIYQATKAAHPVATTAGELTAETAPFAAVPMGAIPSAGVRTAVGAGLGAVQGGIMANAEEGMNPTTGAALGAFTGAAAELILPPLTEMAGNVFRKLTGRVPEGALLTKAGTATPEFKAVLDDAGLTVDDFTTEAVGRLKKQYADDPEVMKRIAAFEAEGVPYSRGDITQKFDQQALENRLLESSGEAGGQMRALRQKQSAAIGERLDEMIERTGVGAEMGEQMKDALTSRKTMLSDQRKRFYQQAAAEAKDVGGLPLLNDKLVEAIPDEQTLRRIAIRNKDDVKAFRTLLAEFGVDQSDEGLKLLKSAGLEQKQLTFENYDTFRQALGDLMKVAPGEPNPMGVIAGPMKQALDAEADLTITALEGSAQGENMKKAVDYLKEGRKATQQLKQEFSPQSITGKLIGTKQDGWTPLVEASKVYNEIIGTGSKPTEFLDRTVESLRKLGGEKGREAMGALQSATLMDLLNSGFKAATRKVEGQSTFSSTAFQNRINAIGKERLQKIFSTNPEAYRSLMNIAEQAESITTSALAQPKGSSSTLIDMFQKLGVFKLAGTNPITKPAMEGFASLMGMAGDRAALQKALDTSQAMKRTAGLLEAHFPAIAQAIGIVGLTRTGKKDEGDFDIKGL